MLLPLVGTALWSASRTYWEREQELREQARAVANTAAAHLDQYFSGLDALASALVQHPAVIALDTARCGPLATEISRNQPLLTNIIVVDAAGAVRCSAQNRDPHGQILRPWVAEVIRGRHSVVSELFTGELSGKPVVAIGYPVRSGGDTVHAVLGLGVDLSELKSVFARIPLPAQSVVMLTDDHGRVLARSLEPEKYIGTIIEPPPDVSGPPQREARLGVDRVERFYGTALVNRGPWVLNVGIPKTVVGEQLLPLRQRNIGIALSGILGVLLLSLLTSSQIAKHLDLLRSAAQRIAAGDLSPVAPRPGPNRELADLQESFVTMAANLREARDALDRQMEQERKMNETLHTLERQVVRQERLAAVGLLVSGVAHELNNPLQAILGTAEMLERGHGLDQKALAEIAFLKTQSGRAGEIIRNLSRFSSPHSGKPAFVDLRDVVAEVVQLRRAELDSAGIALDVQARSHRTVYANFTELEQVTLNFVINAQQAIESPGGADGRILIRVFDAGRRVRLEVLDNGPGVTASDEPKLFQPFFTTKPVGKGTGLGLSVSYGIIDSYGGIIGHSPNEWGGATFFFELPANEAAPAEGGASDDRAAVLQRSV